MDFKKYIKWILFIKIVKMDVLESLYDFFLMLFYYKEFVL